jgi:NAD-dependent SIR2 family protein deacetylase
MTEKMVTAECSSCESSFAIEYVEEMVSQDFPEHCPFCGEVIDEITEESYIEDDDDYGDDVKEWD